MGWMPAPIEASVWQSLWALEREKATNYKPTLKETLIDFNIGYIITSVLAVFFVGLGALVMYGSGEVFSDSGIVFSSQVISLYVKTLGNWSLPIITVIALITMASTTLTVVDAYPRSLENCINIIFTKTKENKNVYWIIISLMSLFSFVILMIFTDKLKTMVDFATAISFLSAPIFGYLNYKLVTSDLMPKDAQPNMLLKVLSWIGLIFLSLFSLFYIWSLIR
jgi:Mn2+/Fe2+ NRAMP family transporter